MDLRQFDSNEMSSFEGEIRPLWQLMQASAARNSWGGIGACGLGGAGAEERHDESKWKKGPNVSPKIARRKENIQTQTF